jgi:hypothetical protein
MADTHDAFLAILDQGKIASGGTLKGWAATDSDDPDELDEYLNDNLSFLEDAGGHNAGLLRAHVEHDRAILRAFAVEARTVDHDTDPTLAVLVEELALIVEEAGTQGLEEDDVRDKRKVLIFSYFTDTVAWISEHLNDAVHRDDRLNCYRGRIATLTGTQGSKEAVLWGFAPKTTQAPSSDDLYDIVVATDVLAEGVNLQQARHIINYDLPWNPMRLVQRHGRIDRIGSHHDEVFLRCVFPDQRLDDLLGLEERLHRKIKQAAAAIGVGEVLPGSKEIDLTFAETRDEIERLRSENAGLFERGGTGTGALSGEEYRQELRRALENNDLATRIESLPWGSGSGMAVSAPPDNPPGFVFCIRVGDHSNPLYRYVTLPDNQDPVVIADNLACLDRARPPQDWETPRQLDESTYLAAFRAWEVASQKVVDGWNHYADPANLVPAIPLVMRRSAQLIREHAIHLEVEEIDRVVETLEAPYAERILRLFRDALNQPTEEQQVDLVLQLVNQLGLEAPPPPEPLPQITAKDVHLVCWLAVVPSPLPESGSATPPSIASQIGEFSLGDKL